MIDPEPDTKDWTWVLERACPECGFVADAVEPTALGAGFQANAAGWRAVLSRPAEEVRRRPVPAVWSPLEYACHVRDVDELFADRVRAMLAADPDEPARFANWDQDATALERDYAAAEPATVARELSAAAEAVAELYDGVRGEQWQRRGLRSNGSVFTVASLGVYQLHDVVHHLADVGGAR